MPITTKKIPVTKKKSPVKKRAPRKSKKIQEDKTFIPIQKRKFICETPDLGSFLVKNVTFIGKVIDVEFYVTNNVLSRLGEFKTKAAANHEYLNRGYLNVVNSMKPTQVGEIIIKLTDTHTHTYKGVRLVEVDLGTLNYQSDTEPVTMFCRYAYETVVY